MGAFKRFMFWTLSAAALGGGVYTRHGPGMTIEQEVTVSEVKDYATAEDQAEGEHDYRVLTDKGVFKNTNDWLALKFGSSAGDLQSYFKEGRSYRVKSFEPWITSKIGDPNITSVVPLDVDGDVAINLENNRNPEPPAPPPVEEVKPPFVEQTPPVEEIKSPAEGTVANDPNTNPNVVLMRQSEQGLPVAEGKRTMDNGNGPGYALVANEAAFAKAFFGSNFNTEDLRIHFYEWSYGMPNGDGVQAANVMSHMNYSWHNGQERQSLRNQTMKCFTYGDTYTSQDYTREDLEKFSVWMHEMTHVWQGQALDRYTLGTDPGYDYVLSPQKKFTDYGTEQQGDIVCDYVGRYLHVDAKWRNEINGGLKKEQADYLLKEIIETQFPGAKTLRLQMEQYRKDLKSTKNAQTSTRNMPHVVVKVPTS